jgi:tRNA U34 2-thiouridine synthase MnmA/TrmU
VESHWKIVNNSVIYVAKKKGLALLSGGLDSTLAVKAMVDQGVEIEAVHFTTPFCNCDKCSVDQVGEQFDVPVHHLFMGQDFLDLLADPPHGYGSQMNICIDCRIHMFKKAKELGDEIGAEFFVTGEVLGQRPFSQRRKAMDLIEAKAGLEGRILRPLSAKLMRKTEVEEEGVVDRESLYAIQGRRRIPQIELAEELGVYDYPCPSGGCLLTDPQFAKKLRDYIHHDGKPELEDMILLRLGRHFRLGQARAIVGRNEKENNVLSALAEKRGFSRFEVSGHMGPVSILVGDAEAEAVEMVAALTVRYSDAPRDETVEVDFANGDTRVLRVSSMGDEEIEGLRI